jgi:hypothetical protein
MLRLGYKLMSEEHGPKDLVENAERAEKAGFDYIVLTQIGPEQDYFLDMFEKELAPALRQKKKAA